MKQYVKAGEEPELQEMMDDPIIRLVMKSDGVSMGALQPLLQETREKMQQRKGD